MTTATYSSDFERAEVERSSAKWWLLLLTGIAWILLGVIVLDGDFDSAVTIGYIVGGYFIAAAVMEFIMMGVVEGWKWLHAVLGVLFILGGIAAFTTPFQTYALLASLVGFFLVLKGTFDLVVSIASRHEVDLWWMLLISGIIEIALGFWASGYPGRSASLLVLWIGLGGLIRGVTQIVLSFQVRKVHKAVV